MEDQPGQPDFYATLNVPRSASDDEIKKAYRRLAQVFHPDKHATDHQREKAQEAFARLHAAYEVLSNPEKREVYDVYGAEGLAAGLEVRARATHGAASSHGLEGDGCSCKAANLRASPPGCAATHMGAHAKPC